MRFALTIVGVYNSIIVSSSITTMMTMNAFGAATASADMMMIQRADGTIIIFIVFIEVVVVIIRAYQLDEEIYR